LVLTSGGVLAATQWNLGLVPVQEQGYTTSWYNKELDSHPIAASVKCTESTATAFEVKVVDYWGIPATYSKTIGEGSNTLLYYIDEEAYFAQYRLFVQATPRGGTGSAHLYFTP